MRRLFRWIALGVAAVALAGSSGAAEEGEGEADYKVVVWYRKAEPIDTFKYQIYDLRKHEYAPAVDDWLELMRTRYPNYEVIVRDVDVERETGPSERRKVGAVIHRELLSAAAAQGVFVGPAALRPVPPMVYQPPGFLEAPVLPRGPVPGYGYSPTLPFLYQNQSPWGFPVPMPYPRPHP